MASKGHSGRDMAARADLLLLFVTLIWGSSFVIVKGSLASISPVLFIALRFLLASLVLAVLLPRAVLGLSRRALLHGAIVGFFLFSGFVFQTLGLKYTTPSKSAFITGFSVLLVPAFGLLFFRIVPQTSAVIGVIMAFVGLMLLTLPSELILDRVNRGDVLTFLCAVAFAFHILSIDRLTRRTGYVELTVTQVFTAAALSLLSVFSIEDCFMDLSPALALSVMAMGVFATALAFYVQSWAQQYTTATRAALIFSMEPIFALVFSYIFYGERLLLRELAGGLLIVLGVIIAELGGSEGQR